MKIVLGEFKDEGVDLATFLEPRIGTKANSSGGEIDIDDDSVRKQVKPRHVKTYIKRFLHKKGERDHYKILVEGNELTLVYLEEAGEKEKEKEEKKREEVKVQREEDTEDVSETLKPEGKQEGDEAEAAGDEEKGESSEDSPSNEET